MIPGYSTIDRRIGHEQVQYWKVLELDGAAVEHHLAAADGRHGRTYTTQELPGGLRAFVKIYRPRAGHSLLRGLRHSRAIPEGKGFLAFAKAGIPTPRLLAWGEARRAWLWTRGVVITSFEDCPTVAERFAESPCPDAIEKSCEMLCQIHGKRLVHGDPRLRNFLLKQNGAVLCFDLCSWRPLTETKRLEDLIIFLGSALKLVPLETGMNLLNSYARQMSMRRMPAEKILASAQRYAAAERKP